MTVLNFEHQALAICYCYNVWNWWWFL